MNSVRRSGSCKITAPSITSTTSHGSSAVRVTVGSSVSSSASPRTTPPTRRTFSGSVEVVGATVEVEVVGAAAAAAAVVVVGGSVVVVDSAAVVVVSAVTTSSAASASALAQAASTSAALARNTRAVLTPVVVFCPTSSSSDSIPLRAARPLTVPSRCCVCAAHWVYVQIEWCVTGELTVTISCMWTHTVCADTSHERFR